MKLKKLNAVLALLSVIGMLLHIGYNTFSYLTMFYNPALKFLTAIPFIVLTCMHAVLGMFMVFLLGDGTRLDLYPLQNMQTVIQRITAALIFPLLIIHLSTFDFLIEFSVEERWMEFALVIMVQIIFYGVSISHAAVSFPKALVTLGIIDGRGRLKVIEKISVLIGLVIFHASACAVIRGELIMFLPGQG